MDIETSISFSGVPILTRFAEASGKTFRETLLQTARGAVRHAIKITPPAAATGGAGTLDSGPEARRRGESAIRRDLHYAFAPVKLKGKRKEQISGAQLVAIHHRLLAAKRPGSPMERDRGQPYFVDIRKLKLLQNKLVKNVGKLASGWVASAQALNAKGTPAWVARHGAGRGAVDIQLEGSQIFVSATNVLGPHTPAWVGPEMQRRARYAQQYALNDLTRQMPALLARDARQSGLGAA
jgi:hypothetical protein